MLVANNVGLQYGKRVLFDEVNSKSKSAACAGIVR